jgi:hypothetical protein
VAAAAVHETVAVGDRLPHRLAGTGRGVIERLCQIDGVTRSGDQFTAGAIWRRNDDGTWVCVNAAPIIRWMIGKAGEQVRRYMLGMGWHWQWIDPPVAVERAGTEREATDPQ